MTFTSEDIRYARNRLKVDLETPDLRPEPVEQFEGETEYENPQAPARGILNALLWVVGGLIVGGGIVMTVITAVSR